MLQRFLDPATLASISGLDLVAKTVVDGFVAGLKRMVNGYEGPVPKTSISALSVLDSLPADTQSRAETQSNRPVLSPCLSPRLRDSAVNGEPQ
jgi:hypothetical protein